MRLKVEMGQGRERSQKVTTEDGEIVEGVKEVRWIATAQGPPILVVELFAEKVEFDLGNSPEHREVTAAVDEARKAAEGEPGEPQA